MKNCTFQPQISITAKKLQRNKENIYQSCTKKEARVVVPQFFTEKKKFSHTDFQFFLQKQTMHLQKKQFQRQLF